jgi:mRNA interferase RelE/StbE
MPGMTCSSSLAALMHYRLDFSEQAREELRALPREQRRRIGQKLDALQTNLQRDVKKLEGQKIKYRLRVGTYRLLFTLEKDLIFIHAVKDRKDVYRN